MTYTPDAKGRGAWTRTGGLLSDNGTGAYYRLSKTGEKPVGSAWVDKSDTSDAAHAVNAGTKALQVLVGITGADLDGWYGPQTDKAVRAAQTRLGLTVDGIVGARTMRALLTPGITAAATANKIPLRYFGGILVHESLLDPAAVGYTTPNDHGLPQINLDAFDEESTEYISYDRRWTPASRSRGRRSGCAPPTTGGSARPSPTRGRSRS
jgi:peptidoglycan hydrolase-like protein with peptidoglycan-binding domain